MFNHEYFDIYEFKDLPVGEDCYLMDEKWMVEYEKMMLKSFDSKKYEPVGYISHASVKKIYSDNVEISWYPYIFYSLHEVIVKLPKNAFVFCVGSWQWSEKPRIFVKSDWYENLHFQNYSIFVLIDAIGVRKSIEDDNLSRDKLILLRDDIDILASKNTDISFFSFADSLLLKSNWSTGTFEKSPDVTYQPKKFFKIIKDIQEIFRDRLGLEIYAILTQGSNFYYKDPNLHISTSGNHISLNSLGLPFAELMNIDNSVRKSLKQKIHEPTELYMDKKFFYSLRFKTGMFEKLRSNKNTYESKFNNSKEEYFYNKCSTILDSLMDDNVEN